MPDFLPLSKEEAAAELKRIFGSFSKEFKQATILLLRTKVLYRLRLIQSEFPNKTPLEQLELAWSEISLEMIMILTDAITRLTKEGEEANQKLKAVTHLMPKVSERKQ